MIEIVVATAKDGTIGINNTLPWNCPRDLARFRRLTTGKTVLMGRNTWESLPDKFRPLPKRKNVVLTRDEMYSAQGALVINSLDDLGILDEQIMVIGGQSIYQQLLPMATKIHLTVINGEYEGDAWFHFDQSEWDRVEIDSFEDCTFYELTRK